MRKILLKFIKNIPKIDNYLLLKRRKWLAQKNGYPNWKNILENSSCEIDEYSESTLKKILIATSTGSHLPVMQMETTLAAALYIRGAKVDALLCDKTLPGCQMCEPRFFPNVQMFTKFGPQKDLCEDCYVPGKNNYEALGIEVLSYSQYLSANDLQIIETLLLDYSFDEVEKFEYQGMKIGEHAKAGALRFFAKATIDDEKFRDDVLKRYLEAALITMFSMMNLLKSRKYDCIIFHHGIYVPQGIIGEVARKYGVRVVNWNPAYRENCFIFSHEKTYHHTLMDEPVYVWEDMQWSQEKEQKINNYLKSRWTGSHDWIKFHDNPKFNKNEIINKIGFDPNKPLIGLFTNVMWDAQLHYPSNAFNNMLEWLIFTVKWFASHKDLQLVIRIHPAEVTGSVPSRQPVIKELRKHFDTLPGNVYVISPEDNTSSYVLAEMCDSVLIYGTKMGVELTSMGIPVIVAGEAWIRNKGITFDAASIDDYKNLLNRLPFATRLSSEVVARAKKYAYHFFFRRMIPVKYFEKGPGWPPYVFKQKSLDCLKPEIDAGLDCICEGILNNKPFVFDNLTNW